MKRFIAIVLLASCASVQAQSSRPAADERSFELSAVVPPTPALKYELLYDTLLDRRPGNAAILYMQAVLLMGPDAKEKSEKALEAYENGNLAAFNDIAQMLDFPPVFQELDLAGRRDQCDWQPPIREKGGETYLPHLEPLAHAMTRLIKIKALRQMEQGQIDDALQTLRLGYEMSDKVGREPTMISALVSLAMTTQMNDALARLMSRPDAPNLYWALSEFPSRRYIYREALYGERRFLVPATPNLAKAMMGEDLTAEQWRVMLDYIAKLNGPDQVKQNTLGDAAALQKARQEYAQTRHLPAEQVERVDPIIVLGNFYMQQAIVISDDVFKLRGLPYPLLLAKAAAVKQQMDRVKSQYPGNPFLPLFDIGDAAMRFARTDRQLAALTGVEAIRSYAAANSGKLPGKLSDVTDTPAPENPLTGKPFEYQVENDAATLSDPASDPPLTYHVKIRK